VNEGNLVHYGDAGGIVVITQVQPISVLFTLPQQQLPTLTKSISEGVLTAYALTTDSQSELDTGTLKVIDNQVDQQTGTIRLKADFPNDKRQLWPGQFVNVRLLVDTLKGVIVAPPEAVQRGPDGTYVYVVGADNTAEMRQVKISRQTDKYAVIADGLAAGEKVVTSGFGRLKDGATVSVSDGNAPQPSPPALSKKSADGKDRKKAASASDTTTVGVQAAQAMAQPAAPAAAPDTALVTGSTNEGGKPSGKHHHSHRDNGASP
ncbi:MAG: efflux RND transporter periplasmic adaptor subunit, partial [Hyphomicrobium sp.]|nr:efflux RND transporter periplasmic adaptor subunit [Hyphomicrobium sp.]